MHTKNIIIAASGTGGHLLPALYIADSLRRKDPTINIYFIGSGRELEAKLIDNAGYKRFIIDTVGVKRRGFKGILKWLIKLPQAFIKISKIYKENNPVLVIGVGGYVSVIPVVYAWMKNIPSIVHEAEKQPGLANYYLSLFSKKISVAHSDCILPFWSKKIFTGQPIRPELFKVNFFKKEINPNPSLLVIGGSLGSMAIDKLLIRIMNFLKVNNFKVTHQSREENRLGLIEAYAKSGIEAKIFTFIENIPLHLANADIVISRAGASSVLEIEYSQRLAILIPLPGAKEQNENAFRLSLNGQAVVIKENPTMDNEVIEAVEKFLCSKYYEHLFTESNDSNVVKINPADLIADECLKIISNSKL